MVKFCSYICAFFLILTFYSCHSSIREEFVLKATGDSLSFSLNSNTSVLARALFLYNDETGKEYLTFQNEFEPEILVYDMNTQEHVNTIVLEKEGSNGVGEFCGYYIESWDEIYIPCTMKCEIDVVDSAGIIHKRFPYSKTMENKKTIPFAIRTSSPLHVIAQNIYIPQSPNLMLGDRTMEDSPVTLVLDTVTNQLEEFELQFPPIMTSEKIRGSTMGIELEYSRCYDGTNFLYSFYFDEDISVVSTKGRVERKVKVRSRYLDHIYSKSKTPSDLLDLAKTLCEIPFYGPLIYDKYRQVYYRFVYPETETSSSDKYVDVWLLGRSKFSIIILDKNLEVIGETLFPENIYSSKLFFVREDGLYLSTSFIKNPNFSDDELRFERIELIKSK